MQGAEGGEEALALGQGRGPLSSREVVPFRSASEFKKMAKGCKGLYGPSQWKFLEGAVWGLGSGHY